jgi:hypothetical protein
MTGGPELIAATVAAGKDWYQVDHGYFGRGHYFRATKNAVVHNKVRKVPRDRWAAFNIGLQKWRTGSYILVCLQTRWTYKLFDDEHWDKTIEAEIRKYTDRPIRIRSKGVGGIERELKDAHAVVTYSSASALDAWIRGVPAFSVCAPTKPLEDSWDKMETPSQPDRESLLCSVAYGQFTPAEMKSGFARSLLESDHDIL